MKIFMPASDTPRWVSSAPQTSLKREFIMKTVIQHPRYLKSTACKVVTALAFTLAIGVFSISPAFADHGRGGGGHEGGHGHDDHDHGGWHGGHGGYGYGGNGYGYAQPVYVPPPVYVVPPQSPGINIVVPLNLRF
jgi:hypothetical protein